MTATEPELKEGRIVAIAGPVVDIEFPLDSLPNWLQMLGMTFSLMLWAPSWGGMLNGLFTLRGGWSKLRTDPVIKFFAAGVTFYGMATFEGPLLSIKSVSALAHYSDWIIGHVHAGTLQYPHLWSVACQFVHRYLSTPFRMFWIHELGYVHSFEELADDDGSLSGQRILHAWRWKTDASLSASRVAGLQESSRLRTVCLRRNRSCRPSRCSGALSRHRCHRWFVWSA